MNFPNKSVTISSGSALKAMLSPKRKIIRKPFGVTGKPWDLLPEPKTSWEAATWLLGAIGDANF
jgi:hypothetical protein